MVEVIPLYVVNDKSDISNCSIVESINTLSFITKKIFIMCDISFLKKINENIDSKGCEITYVAFNPKIKTSLVQQYFFALNYIKQSLMNNGKCELSNFWVLRLNEFELFHESDVLKFKSDIEDAHKKSFDLIKTPIVYFDEACSRICLGYNLDTHEIRCHKLSLKPLKWSKEFDYGIEVREMNSPIPLLNYRNFFQRKYVRPYSIKKVDFFYYHPSRLRNKILFRGGFYSRPMHENVYIQLGSSKDLGGILEKITAKKIIKLTSSELENPVISTSQNDLLGKSSLLKNYFRVLFDFIQIKYIMKISKYKSKIILFVMRLSRQKIGLRNLI